MGSIGRTLGLFIYNRRYYLATLAIASWLVFIWFIGGK